MEKESEIVLQIAKTFHNYINDNVDTWNEAYLRFNGDDISAGITCTYLNDNIANYVQTKNKQLKFSTMASLTEQFQNLQCSLPFKVALLVIKPSLDFKIKYEQSSNLAWAISKLDGNSGIPIGYKYNEWW